MNKSMWISFAFISVFVLLSLLGVLFGGDIADPIPKKDDVRYNVPNNVVFVAPQGKLEKKTDPESGRAMFVADQGFAIKREVPAEYIKQELDPCSDAKPPEPSMELKDVRSETHSGTLITGEAKVEEDDGQVLVRVPSGGTLVERTVSFSGLGTWLAAFLTLCILSFLYDDNPFYKFAEHLFVGVSAAYWMTLGFWTVLVPNLMGKLWPSLIARINPGVGDVERNLIYLIPLIFGIILLFRLSKKFGWISRWSLAFIVGTTAGLNFVAFLQSDFVGQIEGTISSLVVIHPETGFSLGGTFSAIVMVFGVLASLIYFFFSSEHKGMMGVGSRIGIWVLMVTFGASFGYTVMGRIALLVGRMEFLFADWLNIIIQ